MPGKTWIIHYTGVNPFISPHFKELKVDELLAGIYEAVGSHHWQRAYWEEMLLWGEIWEEIGKVYINFQKMRLRVLKFVLKRLSGQLYFFGLCFANCEYILVLRRSLFLCLRLTVMCCILYDCVFPAW
jgi:hypothetical protein